MDLSNVKDAYYVNTKQGNVYRTCFKCTDNPAHMVIDQILSIDALNKIVKCHICGCKITGTMDRQQLENMNG